MSWYNVEGEGRCQDMAFIRVKVKKGNRYYYVVESRRDGPGGKPRQHTLEYLGPEKKFLATAIGWWEQAQAGAQAQSSSATFKSYDYGAPAALWKVAATLGLEHILDSSLPQKTVKGLSRGRVLTLVIIHRAIDPECKTAFSGWCAGTSLPYHLDFDASDLDAEAIWDAMDGVSEEEIDAAQRAIVAKLGELFPSDLGSLRLDYTGYHTQVDSRNDRCTISLGGRARRGRDNLWDLSLAILTAAKLPVPIVWELYEYTENEFSDVSEKVVRELGASKAQLDYTVAFDGSYNSGESLGHIPFHFVCGHPLTGLEHLCDIDRSLYEKVDIGGGQTRMAYRVDDLTFSGVTGTGVLTLDDDLYQDQVAELKKDEAKLKAKARDLSERLKNPRSALYTKMRAVKDEGSLRERKPVPDFDEEAALKGIVEAELFQGRPCCKEFWNVQIDRDEDGARKLSVTCDEAAREAYCIRTFGKALTVTDRTAWTTAEILSIHAFQERMGDFLKTTRDAKQFSMRSEGYWTDDRIRMHVFVCLTAVTLTEVLRRLLEDSAGIGLSKHVLLDRLGLVHDGLVIVDGQPRRAVEDLSTKERVLWDAVVALPGETLGVDQN